MYTPKPFEVKNLAELQEFIEAYPFAILTSNISDALCGTHLPVLLERNRGRHGTIVGHLAGENTQGRSANGKEVLVIFSGPHAYISPSWYQEENVVPTWNYLAVHAYGTLSVVEDEEATMHILQQYVEQFEATQTHRWKFDPTTDFAQRLARLVVGFTVEIERLEGKWKLSQNHSPERQRKVIEGLCNVGGEQERQVAQLIERQLVRNDDHPR